MQIGNGIQMGDGLVVGSYSTSILVNPGSVLFNASPSQWLSVPNSSAFTQNQPFTIECWYRPTSTTTSYVWAMLQTNFLTLKWENNNFKLDMSYVGNPPGYGLVGTTYSINNWYHLALTWNGTNGRLFVNGAIEATFTGAGATVSDGNDFRIGQYQGQGFATLPGYISNFRVVKGVSVYTGSFTPPTSPLTVTQSAGTNISAITAGQTQLLLNTTNDANFLKDSSDNNFTVTNNGSVTSSSLKPF